MKNASKISFLFISLWLFMGVLTYAQGSKSALEKERKAIEKEIAMTKELLQEITSDRTRSVSELKTLERQINLRKKYIGNLNKDIKAINSSINQTSDIVGSLSKDLESLKEKYAAMLVNAYKSRSTFDKWIFLFSADSFNDAIKRWNYLQKLGEFRGTQNQLIASTIDDLTKKTGDLEQQKKEKQSLLGEELKQQRTLSSEREQKDDLLAELQDKEKDLKKSISGKEKDAKKLDKQIANLIAKEIAAEQARIAAAKNSNKSTSSPELAKLSADFAANKGRLPYPVGSGFIASTFGKHQHPVLKYIWVENNGIDISTAQHTRVRAIFSGEVVSVFYNPGFQKAVLVKHGDYYTVYSNLKDVFVKKGDKINTFQDIGVVFTNEKESKTEVHLEVWKGTTKLDPALWISKK